MPPVIQTERGVRRQRERGRRDGLREIGVVQQIEDVDPQLPVQPLADLGVLDQRHINVGKAGTNHLRPRVPNALPGLIREIESDGSSIRPLSVLVQQGSNQFRIDVERRLLKSG